MQFYEELKFEYVREKIRVKISVIINMSIYLENSFFMMYVCRSEKTVIGYVSTL